MKILVTGGAGYIGSTLVPILLSSGHQVRVLDNLTHGGKSLLGVWPDPKFEFYKGDVRNEEDVRAALKDVEAVIHLAAIVGDPACARQPELARAVNLEGSINLFNLSRGLGIKRFIFASTCSNYGKMKDDSQYVDETSELRPVSLYAETKVAVENYLLNPEHSGSLIPTVLRFATAYGVSPRMRFDLTVNEFTMELLTARKLVIFGEQFWRPYVHIRDISRAILCILESPAEKVRNEVFNVGSTNQNFQKQQLAALISSHMPDALIEYVRKNEDPRDYRVSFEKIKQQIGFKTEHTVENGIQEVVHLVQSGIIQDFKNPEFRNIS
jgi:nucleoside-diphosphate-sugar epimerase